MLAPELPTPVKASVLANAIEALANKVRYQKEDETDRGSRAFNTYPDVWDYDSLSREQFYVRNTLRQATSRALRDTVDGIGFVRGRFFNSYALTGPGKELAEVFLSQPAGGGRSSLRAWLTSWVGGKGKPGKNHLAALGARCATEGEISLVRDRLLGVGGPAGDKRRALQQALAGLGDDFEPKSVPGKLAKLGHKEHAQEIRVALAFGAFFDAGRSVIEALTIELEDAPRLSAAAIAKRPDVKKSVTTLKKRGEQYQKQAKVAPHEDATSLASTVQLAGSDTDILKMLVRRDGQIVAIEDGQVARGALYRVMREEETDDEDEFSERSYRLYQMARLLEEVEA